MSDTNQRIADIVAGIARGCEETGTALVGGETAGIPFAAWIADRLQLPMLYVRKQPKGFGRLAHEERCGEGKCGISDFCKHSKFHLWSVIGVPTPKSLSELESAQYAPSRRLFHEISGGACGLAGRRTVERKRPRAMPGP